MSKGDWLVWKYVGRRLLVLLVGSALTIALVRLLDASVALSAAIGWAIGTSAVKFDTWLRKKGL